jgi:hypothetical protein
MEIVCGNKKPLPTFIDRDLSKKILAGYFNSIIFLVSTKSAV